MPERTTKLFAIISTSFSRVDTGRVTPHILGAIFDVDAQGVATDCTAIDFDGKTIRRWPRNNFGSGKMLNDHVIPAESAIFFPITDATAEMMKEAIDEVAVRLGPKKHSIEPGRSDDSACQSDNPFYFELYPKDRKKPMLERYGHAPVDFSGKPVEVPHAQRLTYQRNSAARPQAATNCVTFLQEVMEKIGGVPLHDFVAASGATMPRDGDPFHMADFMIDFIGNKGVMYDKKVDGKMIDLGYGRKAYGFQHATGWITASLNGLPKVAGSDGETLSVAQYLLKESKPFYDPALNAHDLGRASPPRGAGR